METASAKVDSRLHGNDKIIVSFPRKWESRTKSGAKSQIINLVEKCNILVDKDAKYWLHVTQPDEGVDEWPSGRDSAQTSQSEVETEKLGAMSVRAWGSTSGSHE